MAKTDKMSEWKDERKKQHQCGEEFECYLDEDGEMYLQIYDMHGRCSILKVNFCPYCGEKANE